MMTMLYRWTMIVCLLSAFALPATPASAQAAKDLIGTWMLVSVTVDRGGTKSEPFGPNPRGLLIFDSSGRFSMVAARVDLPKIAANSRVAGSAKENRAIVQGSLAYFGTYSVSPADRWFILHVEGGTFPNWVGTDQKRIFTIVGEQLRYTNTVRSGGEGTALVVWQRVK